MEKVLYFNICAIPIYLIIIVTTIYRRMTVGRANLLYLGVAASALIACLAAFITELIEELQEDLIDEARTLSIRFAVTDPETESLCGFFESAGFFEDDRGGKNTYIVEMTEVSQVLEKLREQIQNVE